MKKVLCFILTICFSLSPLTVYATNTNDSPSFGIPLDDIINSEISFNENGETSSIELNNQKQLGSDGIFTNYMNVHYSIIADNISELYSIYETLITVKNNPSTKGSGSENEYEWFYGSSLCISSTIYYNTFYSANIRYGKIDGVYVQCSVNSGTTLDSIYIYYGEMGFAYGGGFSQYHNEHYINNYSYTSFPSSWPYIYWDASQGSKTGATITATVHRSSSGYKQFYFTHLIIG